MPLFVPCARYSLVKGKRIVCSMLSTWIDTTFLSKNSTKLDGDLQLILGSLGHFLLININFSKFSICKPHLLELVNILAKEKILSISI